MPFHCLILNGAILIYGGVIDHKRREIPDLVPLLLLISGSIADTPLLPRMISALLAGLLLLMIRRHREDEFPGGDFKLLVALAYACGPFSMIVMLLIAVLCARLVSRLRYGRVVPSIPLCTYIAGVYIVLCACLYII